MKKIITLYIVAAICFGISFAAFVKFASPNASGMSSGRETNTNKITAMLLQHDIWEHGYLLGSHGYDQSNALFQFQLVIGKYHTNCPACMKYVSQKQAP